MKKLIYIVGLLLCHNTISAQIEKKLHVSTHLDTSFFYDYSISLRVDPARFILEYDNDSQKFKDFDVKLIAETNIPESESGIGFAYRLNLKENKSYCKNSISGVTTQENFISLKINGSDFDTINGVSSLPLDLTSTDKTLSGISILTLISDNINDNVQVCGGSIIIETELEL